MFVFMLILRLSLHLTKIVSFGQAILRDGIKYVLSIMDRRASEFAPIRMGAVNARRTQDGQLSLPWQKGDSTITSASDGSDHTR